MEPVLTNRYLSNSSKRNNLNKLFFKYFIVLLISGSFIYISYKYNVVYCVPIDQFLCENYSTLPYTNGGSNSSLTYQIRVFEDVFQTINKHLDNLQEIEIIYRNKFRHKSENAAKTIESLELQRELLKYHLDLAKESQRFLIDCKYNNSDI